MRKFLIIALVTTLFWSCEKVNDINDAPYWGIDKELLTFDADGGKEVVKVSSNCRWIITGGDSWCIPSIDKGNGNMSIIFTAAKNDAIRDLKTTFYFEFEGEFGTEIVELKVAQEAQQVDDAATLMDDAVFIAYCYENFDLNKDGTISMMEANTVKVIEIEDEPKLKSVKGISLFTNLEDISFKNTGLQSIDLSKNTKLTTITREAFYDCSSLTSVTIGNNVTSIGSDAFSGCSSLASVTIPNSVTEIGEGAFRYCKGELIINSQQVVGYNYGHYDYDKDEVTANDWLYGSGFTKLTIGDGVTSIGDYAFEDCSSLTSVTIPDSVTEIGHAAFANCSSLTSIVVALDNAVYDSRDNCNAIIETATNALKVGCVATVIPKSVTSIGRYAFYGYSSLAIAIPDSVTSIGDYAFYDCSGELVIDSNFIETDFYDDSIRAANKWIDGAKFSTIIIGDNITSIGSSAFHNCSSLTSVTIGNNVTEIGSYAFYNCSRLYRVTIGNGVTLIYPHAFSECNLNIVYCKPITPPLCDSYTFMNTTVRYIYVPSSSKELYKVADGWSQYSKYIHGYEFE